MNLPTQSVIRADAERTSLVRKELSTHFQQVLTFYCREEEFPYTQGLNELLAPFFYLATERAGRRSP